jgi:hypothetical protein
MNKYVASALIIVLGALLLVVPSFVFERRCTTHKEVFNPHPSRLLSNGCEVVSFHELSAKDGDEFRYCEITIRDGSGSLRTVTLKVKKSLVVDSIKCSIKDLFW